MVADPRTPRECPVLGNMPVDRIGREGRVGCVDADLEHPHGNRAPGCASVLALSLGWAMAHGLHRA